MTTTLVALLLSATALLLYELHAHRQSWEEDLRTQAELMARSSVSALAFDDAEVARANLGLLRLRPQIEAAALYSADGHLFAAYSAEGHGGLPPRLAPTPAVHDYEGELELRQPIFKDGPASERLGTVVLLAHYDVLPRLFGYLAILAAVTLTSLVLASLVARRMQASVTEPIVAVSEVAREVVQQRNYALRAPKTTDDEVGALVDAFNDMLGELGTQAAALQAADRRKDEFLATLGHELRNPLAPVSTALAILARGDTDPATQARLVAMMQRQMQQLVRLIDDLMEVSRISTGRLTLRPETLDLVDVVRGAVESVAPALLERAHRLVVDWPDPVWVQGDRTRLGQVFANLLANAAKYTDPGGRIEIGFELAPASIGVRIADNGIGIAPEMQQQVFEMFVQVDASPTEMRAGLGVGLSLARQLVALHDGSLSLHSEGLGRGSTFGVSLPRCAAPPAAAVPPRRAPAAAVPRRRVLVVDDNRDYADSLAAVLVDAGHQVQVRYDGQGALRAVAEQPPEVGLFDLGMPGLDGYALAQMVRRQPGGWGCLLVAVTGWGQDSDQRRAQAAGFDIHLVKPVDVDLLLSVLDQEASAARAGGGRAGAGRAH